MSTRRMVPRDFFKDPDILSLASHENRLMLLGLILYADDEGRELAHASLLGREWDYPAEQVEQALTDLVDNDLIVLYQIGRHRYFQLTRWKKWQTINPNRMTPSKYPAPPVDGIQAGAGNLQTSACSSQENAGNLQTSACNPQENAGGLSAQLNLIESNTIEEEESTPTPSNVVPFPPPHRGDDNDDDSSLKELTRKVATALKVPSTPALVQLVCDFQGDHTLSLLGEAYAAREYIDDEQRNQKRRTMSVTFFRNWLKREHQSHAAAPPVQATGTHSARPAATPPPASGRPRMRDLSTLAAEYERERSARRASSRPPAQTTEGG